MVDPNAILVLIQNALEEERWDDAEDQAEVLCDWLSAGGAPPGSPLADHLVPGHRAWLRSMVSLINDKVPEMAPITLGPGVTLDRKGGEYYTVFEGGECGPPGPEPVRVQSWDHMVDLFGDPTKPPDDNGDD